MTTHNEKYRIKEVESGEVAYFNDLEQVEKWCDKWERDTDGDWLAFIQINNGMNIYLNPTPTQAKAIENTTGYIFT